MDSITQIKIGLLQFAKYFMQTPSKPLTPQALADHIFDFVKQAGP